MALNLPNAYLSDYPCTGNRCLSQHDQLVTLVYLLNSVTAQLTVPNLEKAVKQYRNLTPPELMQLLIAQFSTTVDVDGTDLKCLSCYSDRKLIEMLTYLMAVAIIDLPLN